MASDGLKIDYAAYVGLDWGSEKHSVAIKANGSCDSEDAAPFHSRLRLQLASVQHLFEFEFNYDLMAVFPVFVVSFVFVISFVKSILDNSSPSDVSIHTGEP
jgi:hypothetical protein